MRTVLALALAVAVAVAVAGCGTSGPKLYENPHGTIGVKKGDELTLQFVVNSGVGYDWQLVPFDLETPKVDLLGTRTIYPNDKRAGESGKRRYRLRATRVGRQILIFQHFFRGRATDRRVVTIDVRPAS
jgi:predicted secreted protein